MPGLQCGWSGATAAVAAHKPSQDTGLLTDQLTSGVTWSLPLIQT